MQPNAYMGEHFLENEGSIFGILDSFPVIVSAIYSDYPHALDDCCSLNLITAAQKMMEDPIVHSLTPIITDSTNVWFRI